MVGKCHNRLSRPKAASTPAILSLRAGEVNSLTRALYATKANDQRLEMAQAGLEVGFGHLGFPEIGSWTLPVNMASQRVMEKLGFRYERDFEFAGLGHRLYWLAAGEWGRYHNGENSFDTEKRA